MELITDLSKLLQFLPDEKKNALVVFDIDETLIYPKNPVIQLKTIKKYPEVLEQFRQLEDKKKQLLLTLFVLKNEMHLINENTPSILESLKGKRATTMALTASYAGDIGPFKKMEEYRWKTLSDLGVNFDDAFPRLRPFLLPKESAWELSPMFYKGIIYSCFYPKGQVFVSFLRKLEKLPEYVLFVDDRKQHVEDVEASLEAIGVKCQGLLYQSDYPSEEVSLKEIRSSWDEYLVEVDEILYHS